MPRAKKRRLGKKKLTPYHQLVIVLTLTFLFSLFLLNFGTKGLVTFVSWLGKKDTLPPPATEKPLLPPRLFPLPIATNSAQMTVRGLAESRSKVEIFLNNKLIGSTFADEEGRFALEKVRLKEGENQIYAISKKENHQSPPSNSIFSILKSKAPRLKIISPSPNTVISQKEGEVKIEGKTDPNVSLLINKRWVIVQSDGSFSFQLPLSKGKNKIEIIAEDVAGNRTLKELTVTYQP